MGMGAKHAGSWEAVPPASETGEAEQDGGAIWKGRPATGPSRSKERGRASAWRRVDVWTAGPSITFVTAAPSRAYHSNLAA